MHIILYEKGYIKKHDLQFGFKRGEKRLAVGNGRRCCLTGAQLTSNLGIRKALVWHSFVYTKLFKFAHGM